MKRKQKIHLSCLLCGILILFSGCVSTFPTQSCRSMRDLQSKLSLPIRYPEFITKAEGASLTYYTVSGLHNDTNVLTGYSIQLTYQDDTQSPCVMADLRGTDLTLAEWDLMGKAFAGSYWDSVALEPSEPLEDSSIQVEAYKIHRYTAEELSSEKGLSSIGDYLPPPDNGYLFDALYCYWDDGDIRYSLTMNPFFEPTDQEDYDQCVKQAVRYFELLRQETNE